MSATRSYSQYMCPATGEVHSRLVSVSDAVRRCYDKLCITPHSACARAGKCLPTLCGSRGVEKIPR